MTKWFGLLLGALLTLLVSGCGFYRVDYTLPGFIEAMEQTHNYTLTIETASMESGSTTYLLRMDEGSFYEQHRYNGSMFEIYVLEEEGVHYSYTRVHPYHPWTKTRHTQGAMHWLFAHAHAYLELERDWLTYDGNHAFRLKENHYADVFGDDVQDVKGMRVEMHDERIVVFIESVEGINASTKTITFSAVGETIVGLPGETRLP